MSSFVLHTPDTYEEKIASGELKGFIVKRYLARCYKEGVFHEDHEGFLPHASKTGPSRSSLPSSDTVDYYRNAWEHGLNTDHDLVKALLAEEEDAAPAAKDEEPEEETKKTTSTKKKTSTSKKADASKKKEEEAPKQTAPPTVTTARIEEIMRENTDRAIEAMTDLVPADLNDRLERLEGSVDGLHARVEGLHVGQSQIKGGIAYLTEGMMSPEQREEAVSIMDMSLDELVEAGFVSGDGDPS